MDISQFIRRRVISVIGHGSRTVPGCGFPPLLLLRSFFSFSLYHQNSLQLQDFAQIFLRLERQEPLHHAVFQELVHGKRTRLLLCLVAENLFGKISSFEVLFFLSQREIWSWVNSKHVSNKKEMRGVIRAEMFGQLTSGLESAWNKLKGEGLFFFMFFWFDFFVSFLNYSVKNYAYL